MPSLPVRYAASSLKNFYRGKPSLFYNFVTETRSKAVTKRKFAIPKSGLSRASFKISCGKVPSREKAIPVSISSPRTTTKSRFKRRSSGRVRLSRPAVKAPHRCNCTVVTPSPPPTTKSPSTRVTQTKSVGSPTCNAGKTSRRYTIATSETQWVSTSPGSAPTNAASSRK